MGKRLTSKIKTVSKGLVGILLTVALLHQATSAALLSRDFKAQEVFPAGTIVSLGETTDTVVKTNEKNIDHMYGVVVQQGQIALTRPGENTNVSVANEGVVNTFVSTANGDVKKGDAITVVGIEGVGEKATRNGRMVGVAQTDFSGESAGNKEITLTQNGKSKTVHVATIPVKLGVSDYSTTNSQLGSAAEQDRNWLERLADSFAGKQVKPIALFAAGLVLLSGVFIATFLITSSSFASVISIGRNPFARKHIISSLVGLIGMSVGIFGGSLALAYLLLRVLG